MADHLKKYRDYISDLKSGQASGISAAFGRATDLLPPEVMEIKAPKSRTAEQPLELGESVLNPNYDRQNLREKVETLVQAYANDLDDPVGATVETPTGTEEVLSVYVENGERMFMLSDLSVIDEETFRSWLVVSESNSSSNQLNSLNSVDSSNQLDNSNSVDSSNQLHNSNSVDSSNQLDSSDSVESLNQLDSSNQIDDIATDDDNDWDRVLEHLSSLEVPVPQVSVPGAFNLSVTAPNGSLLWQIYYGEDGPELVSMADGGIIKRAEGRSEYIFSRLSATEGDIKFFILTGFVVDPTTGNIYLEANAGAYTAAFFNNGWSIHQYRTHSGEEVYYATEPIRTDRAPITAQVKNLNLDMATGEVSYDTIDSAANITLKSRKL